MVQVKVDKQKCKDLAGVMKEFSFVHPESVDRNSVLFPEKELFYLFIVVGICHQINWNFLMKAFNNVRLKTPRKFTPGYMQTISHQELYNWLKEYPKSFRLGKSFKRATLVQNMCRILMGKYDGKISNILKKANHKMSGKKGLYKLLEDFKAYGEDPLKKKSAVFIGLLEDWGLEKFGDWENYIPPIDYHICRVALRNGVLKIENPMLFKKLIKQEEVTQTEDTAIRSSVIEAFKEISKYSGKGTKLIQGFYWCIGRECCDSDKPRCKSCPVSECTVHHYMKLSCHKLCPFLKVCKATQKPLLLKLKEQNFVTTFY